MILKIGYDFENWVRFFLIFLCEFSNRFKSYFFDKGVGGVVWCAKLGGCTNTKKAKIILLVKWFDLETN
jgi:hypothetical protein